jgi:hypothetical protein
LITGRKGVSAVVGTVLFLIIAISVLGMLTVIIESQTGLSISNVQAVGILNQRQKEHLSASWLPGKSNVVISNDGAQSAVINYLVIDQSGKASLCPANGVTVNPGTTQSVDLSRCPTTPTQNSQVGIVTSLGNVFWVPPPPTFVNITLRIVLDPSQNPQYQAPNPFFLSTDCQPQPNPSQVMGDGSPVNVTLPAGCNLQVSYTNTQGQTRYVFDDNSESIFLAGCLPGQSPCLETVVYHYEVMVSFSYQILGSGNPNAPVVSFKNGVNQNSTTVPLSPSVVTVWANAGSTWQAPQVLSQNNAERWRIVSPSPSGTGSIPYTSASILLQYQHQYSLKVTGDGGIQSVSANGNVSSRQPISVIYWFNQGASVSLSATTFQGYTFIGWTGLGQGSVSSSNPNISVTMNTNLTENARTNINPVTYNLVFTLFGSSSPVTFNIGGGCNPSTSSIQGSGTQSFSASANCQVSLVYTNTPGNTRYAFNNSASSYSIPICPSSQSPCTYKIYYYYQDSITVSYSVNGGGNPSPPTFSYQQFGGTPPPTPLSTSPTQIWVDHNSPWSVTPSIPGGSGERWAADPTKTSGTSSPGLTISITYYHQFACTCSYSTSDGLVPQTSPLLSGVQYGKSYSTSLSFSNQVVWLDAGTTYSIPSPLSGSSSTERWSLPPSVPVSGTVTGAFTLNPTYFHQYFETFSYKTSDGSTISGSKLPSIKYVKFGITVNVSLPLVSAPQTDWFDSKTTASVTQIIQSGFVVRWYAAQSSWLISSANINTLNPVIYYHQYGLSFQSSINNLGVNPISGNPPLPTLSYYFAGSLTNVPIPTTSAVSVWIDAGTSWQIPLAICNSNPCSSSGEQWALSTKEPSTGVASSGSTNVITVKYFHQFYLTLVANPTNGGTVTAIVNSVSVGSGWINASQQFTITASPNAAQGYLFNGWTGTGTGSYTGSQQTATVTMNAPITETGNFIPGTTVVLTFTETGLPSGTSWTVTLSGSQGTVSNTSTSSSMIVRVAGSSSGVQWTWTASQPQSGGIAYVVEQSPPTNPCSTGTQTGTLTTLPALPTQNSKTITVYTTNQNIAITYGTCYQVTFGINTTPSSTGTTCGNLLINSFTLSGICGTSVSGWFAPNTVFTINANPATSSAWFFQNWNGTGPNSYTGVSQKQTLSALSGPLKENASFIRGAFIYDNVRFTDGVAAGSSTVSQFKVSVTGGSNTYTGYTTNGVYTFGNLLPNNYTFINPLPCPGGTCSGTSTFTYTASIGGNSYIWTVSFFTNILGGSSCGPLPSSYTTVTSINVLAGQNYYLCQYFYTPIIISPLTMSKSGNTYTVSGTVLDVVLNSGVSGLTISISGPGCPASVITNSAGQFSFSCTTSSPGTVSLNIASQRGYMSASGTCTMSTSSCTIPLSYSQPIVKLTNISSQIGSFLIMSLAIVTIPKRRNN